MTIRAIGAGTRRLSLVAGFAGALLSGCAPQVPFAGTQFDGVYAGPDSLVRGGGYECGPPSYPLTIAVHGGQFDYPYFVNLLRAAPLPVQVAADGTVHGQMQYGTSDYGLFRRDDEFRTAWVTLDGRIVDTTLEATIADLRCVRHLTARLG
jgi:hypothetical protein